MGKKKEEINGIISIEVKQTLKGKLSVKAFNSAGKRIKVPISITRISTGVYLLK